MFTNNSFSNIKHKLFKVLEGYNSPKLRKLDKDGDKKISTHDFKHLRRKKKK